MLSTDALVKAAGCAVAEDDTAAATAAGALATDKADVRDDDDAVLPSEMPADAIDSDTYMLMPAELLIDEFRLAIDALAVDPLSATLADSDSLVDVLSDPDTDVDPDSLPESLDVDSFVDSDSLPDSLDVDPLVDPDSLTESLDLDSLVDSDSLTESLDLDSLVDSDSLTESPDLDSLVDSDSLPESLDLDSLTDSDMLCETDALVDSDADAPADS